MRKCLWFLLLGIHFGCRSHSYPATRGGSTAICFAYPNIIFIGADSKLVSINSDVVEMSAAGNNCKVHQKDQIIYAAVGMLRTTNPDIDPIRIINRLDLSKWALLKDKLPIIEKEICDSMKAMAESVLTMSPRFFSAKILGKSFATFAFGMFEKDKPVIGYIDMNCKMDKKNRIFFKDSISINYPDNLNVSVLPIGHTEYYDSVSKINGYFTKFHSVVEVIDAIIKGQSIKTPKEVNDTADIIYLTSTGNVIWSERHQECN